MPAAKRWGALAAILALAGATHAARPHDLALRRVVLDLPGPPAVIVPADLDGDGRRDLLIIVAYTRWGSIATDRIEDAIEVTQVVPALFDVRDARAFLAQPDGSYRQSGPPLKLPSNVLSAEAGPKSHPVVAVTDEGLSEIRWSGDGLALVPLLSEPSVFAQTDSLLPELSVLKDVDGDGVLDAVLPTPDGIAIHHGQDGSFASTTSFRGKLPGDVRGEWLGRSSRLMPTPVFEDVDGDGKPDLVVSGLTWREPQWIAIGKGLGGGRFAPIKKVELSCLTPPKQHGRSVAWAGDLTGDGRMELVTREDVETGQSDMKEFKRPMKRYRIHHLRPDLTVEPDPYVTFDAEGWAFSGSFEDGIDLQFIDLDGDKRKDLVTITLDFSMFQALRALTAKKVSVGLEFHVLAQQADGTFRLVPDQKLDETLHLDLNKVEISRLGEFQGDFDGDGRIDFIHLGRGKTVTIHRGEPGGRYPVKPDLAITLDEEPEDTLLVRIKDFDGDGRSDLAITRTAEPPEPGASAPARLELDLSGEAR